MALGQRLHVLEVGKRDGVGGHTQEPDMQRGQKHEDLGRGKGVVVLG